MLEEPLLWVVIASAVIAVGTIAAVMVILEHNQAVQITSSNSILIIGVAGIAIGMIWLVISYNSQIKPIKKIKRMLNKVRMTDIEVNYGEDRKRNYFLQHIISNIMLLIKDLVILENLIRKYSDNPPPKNWQIVKYSADRSRKRTEELEKNIVLDFAQIVDLVENRALAYRLGINNLYNSLYLFRETLRINPEYDKHLLTELRKALREQIAQLDVTVVLLDKERTG